MKYKYNDFYTMYRMINKKLFQFQRVNSDIRRLVIDAYKSKLESDLQKSLRTLRPKLSKALSIGSKTISKITTEYNLTKKIIFPSKTMVSLSFRDAPEEFQRNMDRRHVHSFRFKREIPTVQKIYQVVSNDESLSPISRTNLFHLLKEMDFRYSKRSQNSALTGKS